jgi:hypothetical protein
MTSLDVFWLRGDSLDDGENLPLLTLSAPSVAGSGEF